MVSLLAEVGNAATILLQADFQRKKAKTLVNSLTQFLVVCRVAALVTATPWAGHRPFRQGGRDMHTKIQIPLTTAYQGGVQAISLEVPVRPQKDTLRCIPSI